MADNRQRLSAEQQERSSIEKDLHTIEHVEKSGGVVTADEILNRYPLLVEKSEVDMALLNKKVLKKLDWWFLPTITFMLLMNYLDRINVSNARLAGMQEDLGMSDVEWSAGISLFYVGYIISQVRDPILCVWRQSLRYHADYHTSFCRSPRTSLLPKASLAS